MKTRKSISVLALSAIIGSLLVLPISSLAQSASNAARFPDNTLGFVEFALTGRLNTFFNDLLEKGGTTEPSDEIGKLLLDKLKEGALFSVGVDGGNAEAGLAPGITAAIGNATAENFALLKEDSESAESYEGVEIVYDGVESYAFLLNGTMYISTSLASAQAVIDLANGKTTASLASDASYSTIASHFVPAENFSTFINLGELYNLVAGMFGETVPTGNFGKFLKSIGLSFGEFGVAGETRGYEFQAAVQSDQAFLDENGLKLIPGGLFVPSLYKKFPSTKTLYYAEQNNPAASIDQGDKLMTALFGDQAPAGFSTSDLLQTINEETGIDLNGLIDLFKGPFAIALQDTGKPFPVMTIMADVSMNVSAAKEKGSELYAAIVSNMRESVPAASLTEKTITVGGGSFESVSIDVTKFEDYEGPPFPKVNISIGVTNDNVLVITSDTLTETYGQGLQNNADFSAAYKNKEETVGSISYIDARNIFAYIDSLFLWGNSMSYATGEPVPLESMEGYYEFLGYVYSWKNLFMKTVGSGDSVNLYGMLTMDSATHATFQEFVSAFQEKDTDGDGLSDYEEIYDYGTNPKVKDTDGDGESDKAEIEANSDPRGILEEFKDLTEDAWYSSDVATLSAKNVVKGYGDETFRPGNKVTRAEFTCMAIRAFEDNLAGYLGLEAALTAGPGPSKFTDVPNDAWFASCVGQAASKGFVAGYSDGSFQPGAPIKRAEAIAILAKMNGALNATLSGYLSGGDIPDMPFADVSSDQWFNPYVAAAYENEIALGKRPDTFDPLGIVSRAEAVVMIRRALTVEMTYIEETEQAPPSLTPMFEVLF